MFLTHSFWRKVVATLGAVVGFVFVYEATIPDSRNAAQSALEELATPPKPGSRLHFTATAYCKGDTTASGVSVRTGIAAADPALLPVGTVVQLDTPEERYDGIWTIMDTGPAVQGRIVDLYMWSCHDALKFGRRPIQLTVLRLGGNPRNTAPGRVDGMFRQREIERSQMLAAPVTSEPPTTTPPADAPALAPASTTPTPQPPPGQLLF
jgi:3D (Asp-Asp-Asp) domain-containing protein